MMHLNIKCSGNHLICSGLDFFFCSGLDYVSLIYFLLGNLKVLSRNS